MKTKLLLISALFASTIQVSVAVDFTPSKEQPSCATIATVVNQSKVYDFVVHGINTNGQAENTLVEPGQTKKVYLFSNAETSDFTPFNSIVDVVGPNLISEYVALNKVGVIGMPASSGWRTPPSKSSGTTGGSSGAKVAGAAGAIGIAVNSMCKLFSGADCLSSKVVTCENPRFWYDDKGIAYDSSDDPSKNYQAKPFILKVGNLDLNKNRVLDAGGTTSLNTEKKIVDIPGYGKYEYQDPKLDVNLIFKAWSQWYPYGSEYGTFVNLYNQSQGNFSTLSADENQETFVSNVGYSNVFVRLDGNGNKTSLDNITLTIMDKPITQPTGDYTQRCTLTSWNGYALSANCGNYWVQTLEYARYCRVGSKVNLVNGILSCENYNTLIAITPIQDKVIKKTSRCENIIYSGNMTISATCTNLRDLQNNLAPSVKSSLDYNMCNNSTNISVRPDGTLQCVSYKIPSGSYQSTCPNISFDGININARCHTVKGIVPVTGLLYKSCKPNWNISYNPVENSLVCYDKATSPPSPIGRKK